MTEASVLAPDKLPRRARRWGGGAAALALTLIVTASVGTISAPPPNPRAVAMVEVGREALGKGDANAAIDAFETALALDPGYSDAFVALADATRAQGMPGKSLSYYRRVLEREPRHLAALAGEGQALVARGGLEQAERNLALLESQCGSDCSEARTLRLAIRQDRQARLAAGESEESTPQ